MRFHSTSRNGIAYYLLIWIPVFFIHCAGSPDSPYNQGIRLLESNQVQLAEEQFLQAVETTPKNAEAWNQLGIISFERGELEDAKFRFETAAKINPYSSVYRRNTALVLAKQNHFVIAIELLNQALELEPFDVETYIAIAKVEWLNGEKQKAVDALHQASKIDPANEEVQKLVDRFLH